MKETFIKPKAFVYFPESCDLIAASNEIPSHDRENQGEWDDVD